MKETKTTSSNIARTTPPLENFSQICTILLIILAFINMQPFLVLITTIIMALNALIPAASPYRLLYQYVLVPLDVLKPYPGKEGKLAPYHLSRISVVLLLASTILLFSALAFTFGLGWILGWALDVIVGMLTMVDWGVRSSLWAMRGIFGSR